MLTNTLITAVAFSIVAPTRVAPDGHSAVSVDGAWPMRNVHEMVGTDVVWSGWHGNRHHNSFSRAGTGKQHDVKLTKLVGLQYLPWRSLTRTTADECMSASSTSIQACNAELALV